MSDSLTYVVIGKAMEVAALFQALRSQNEATPLSNQLVLFE
ncbi:MAG TPA: hypothetical protein VFZ59_28095 [Verrucomicrobiae bacterium]|nr:hypothetical protein [Verrucomicrobiae bacterium]